MDLPYAVITVGNRSNTIHDIVRDALKRDLAIIRVAGSQMNPDRQMSGLPHSGQHDSKAASDVARIHERGFTVARVISGAASAAAALAAFAVASMSA